MTIVTVPWAAWYRDIEREFNFPEEWKVSICAMRDAIGITDQEIEKTIYSSLDLRQAIDSAPRDKPVAIAVDDLSRPTPTWRILPHLLRLLQEAGINSTRIRILIAVGAHRILTRGDMLRKLGKQVVQEYDIRNHSAFSNLVRLESENISVEINRTFVEAGLRIGIGCLMPHSEAGYSAGAKIVFPGLAGIDSIESWHSTRSPLTDPSSNLSGILHQNPMRNWMEQVASIVGLNVVIDAVMTSRRNIARLFVGDPVRVHREACNLASQVYATDLPDQVNIAIFNAYPKDTELMQIFNALHIINSSRQMITNEMGTIILMSAASEGRGFHYLFGQGMRLPGMFNPAKSLGNRRLIIYAPNANETDINQLVSGEVELYTRWNILVHRLRHLYGDNCKVAIFPCGSLQVATAETR
jgi:lactate racemase